MEILNKYNWKKKTLREIPVEIIFIIKVSLKNKMEVFKIKLLVGQIAPILYSLKTLEINYHMFPYRNILLLVSFSYLWLFFIIFNNDFKQILVVMTKLKFLIKNLFATFISNPFRSITVEEDAHIDHIDQRTKSLW